MEKSKHEQQDITEGVHQLQGGHMGVETQLNLDAGKTFSAENMHMKN